MQHQYCEVKEDKEENIRGCKMYLLNHRKRRHKDGSWTAFVLHFESSGFEYLISIYL